MPEYYHTVQEGVLRLPTGQYLSRKLWIESIKDGATVREVLTRVSARKTHQQVKTHWGLVIGTVRREFEERGWDLGMLMPGLKVPSGYPVPTDVIQKLLYATCNDVGDNGERLTLSKMSTIQASRFFEKCRDYAAIQWHIIIADPDPNWKKGKEAIK